MGTPFCSSGLAWKCPFGAALRRCRTFWKKAFENSAIPILDVSRMKDSDMAGEPFLHITLTLLKYRRDEDLTAMLRQVFRNVAGQFEGNRALTLLDTIRKYVMSVNPIVGENEAQGIFAEFWPVKPEPGSFADQLLTKGRQEGEIRLIRTLESILGVESEATDLSGKSLEELQKITESLQARIHRRGARHIDKRGSSLQLHCY